MNPVLSAEKAKIKTEIIDNFVELNAIAHDNIIIKNDDMIKNNYTLYVGKDLSNDPGLNIAHASYLDVLKTARCIDKKIILENCVIFFEEYQWIGRIHVTNLELSNLIDFVKFVHDSVFIYIEKYQSYIRLDYYENNFSEFELDYSLIVQGEKLELALKECFNLKN